MKRNRDDDDLSVGLVKDVPFADALPVNAGRNELVDSLLMALGLSGLCETIPFSPCRAANLEMFHDDAYVKALERGVAGKNAKCCFVWRRPILLTTMSSKDASFGLEYDCHPFPHLLEHCKNVAGATLSAAAWLTRPGADSDEKRIAINWTGGRHHARSASASGYCFVNDAVLSTLFFRRRGCTRLAYFDMDIHAGDAVEQACERILFSSEHGSLLLAGDSDILYCSTHLYETGFFPYPSGHDSEDHVHNFPLKRG